MPPLTEEESRYPEVAKDRRVVLNVGGVRHEVLCQTLGRLPDTRLGRLLSCDTHDALLQLCDGYTIQNNEYYFDRTSTNFYAILNLYRTGKLHILQETCALSLQDDLNYWKISDTYLEPCCQLKYYEQDIEKTVKGMLNERIAISKGRILREMLWNVFEIPVRNKWSMIIALLSAAFVILYCIEFMFCWSSVASISGDKGASGLLSSDPDISK